MGSCNLPIDRSNWEESQPKISLILHANLTFTDEKGEEEGRSVLMSTSTKLLSQISSAGTMELVTLVLVYN